ncbi:MAG: AmmeMemoRadiSam system radical SAM enzyme [Spirochaetales bacterium]|nr:AmmeMemoRadiSam system radical SAM enzyme [Spirochaetales bacterium]
MEARFFEKKDGKKIKCLLCPHRCLIADGKRGICGVRLNRNGDMNLPYYGKLSGIATDPVEKKPLYHFYPGRSILSVGFWGCSFRCPFCQNYSISQKLSESGEYISPRKLVDIASSRGSFGIAYTYSEPLVHSEYVLDTSAIAHRYGLKNVLISNGYVNPGPAEELLEVIDAANIDLKSFQSDFYKKEIGGGLSEVKEFISLAAGRAHIEVTTLVIPTKNDSEEEIGAIASFLASIDKNIPFHLSCYYPTYEYSIPPTSRATIEHLADTARNHLNYVYLGNVGANETNTYCTECHALLIRRAGYRISIVGIEEGKCSECHASVPIQGLSAS